MGNIGLRINDVFKTSALDRNKNDFFATHTSFNKLYYNNKILGEKELFNNEILPNIDAHNFAVVKGIPGTGKSHFIKWLNYKLLNDLSSKEHEILLISRRSNTLKATLSQLLELDVLKSKSSTEEFKKILNANKAISKGKLLNTILHQFAIEVQEDFDKHHDVDYVHAYLLYLNQFLVDNLVRNELLKEDGPIERIRSKISDENLVNYKEAKFTHSDFDFIKEKEKEILESSGKYVNLLLKYITDKENLRKTVDYLNSKVSSVIKSSIKLDDSDLKNIFIKIRKELKKQDKNLIILIEDITSFTGMDQGIIEVLTDESSESNGMCNLFSIIGITDGYYNKLPDNIKHRVTGRIELKDDNLLSNNSKLYEISAKYINAINLTNDELREWENYDYDVSKFPIANVDRYIDNWCQFHNKGITFNIYPFNRKVFDNLYIQLENKSEIRSYLRVLRRLYLKMYENNFEILSIETIKALDIGKFEWKNISDRGKLRDNLEKKDTFDKMQSLYLLWGTRDLKKDDHLQDIFQHFGLQNDIFDGKINVRPPDIKPPIQPIRKPKNVVNFEERRKDVMRWINKEDNLKNYREIKGLIIDFFRDVIDWNSYKISDFLLDHHLNDNAVLIDGMSNSIKKYYLIKRDDANASFMMGIFAWKYLGNESWNFPDFQSYYSNVNRYLFLNEENFVSSIFDKTVVEEFNKIPVIKLINNVLIGKSDKPIELNAKDSIRKLFEINYEIEVNKIDYSPISPVKSILLNIFNLTLGGQKQSSDVLFLDIYEYNKVLSEVIDVIESYDSETLLEKLENHELLDNFNKICNEIENYRNKINEIKTEAVELDKRMCEMFEKIDLINIDKNLEKLKLFIDIAGDSPEISLSGINSDIIDLIYNKRDLLTKQLNYLWNTIQNLIDEDQYIEFWKALPDDYYKMKVDIENLYNLYDFMIQVSNRFNKEADSIKKHHGVDPKEEIFDLLEKLQRWF